IIAVASCYWVLATAMIWRLLRQGNPLARLFIYDHPSIYSTGVFYATITFLSISLSACKSHGENVHTPNTLDSSLDSHARPPYNKLSRGVERLHNLATISQEAARASNRHLDSVLTRSW
ncbi:MAG: hypothetical protein M3437_14885, partial [Chloroflexota bacterium]|nr:hypothetical protein [Chloroflexota bacterium]